MSIRNTVLSILAGAVLAGCSASSARDARSPGSDPSTTAATRGTVASGAVCEPTPNKAFR